MKGSEAEETSRRWNISSFYSKCDLKLKNPYMYLFTYVAHVALKYLYGVLYVVGHLNKVDLKSTKKQELRDVTRSETLYILEYEQTCMKSYRFKFTSNSSNLLSKQIL